MIGLDTNVLLRLGDNEEPGQRDRVRALVRSRGKDGSFVNVVVASSEEASRAVESFREGPADFAHCFLAEINASSGCAMSATFDSASLNSREPFAAVPIGA
jgi:predicted nucleic-acid-binding protein